MPQLSVFLNDKDPLVGRSAEILAGAFGVPRAASAVSVYVPGRVEFLGKHTDYAGGRSLLMAVDRGFRLVAVGRQDKVLRVSADGSLANVQEFAFGHTPAHEPGHWVNYVATVARRVLKNFADAVELKGADIAFISDLPVASGMSSSSALMVTIFRALGALNHLDRTGPYRNQIHSPLELAEYLGCVENGQSFGALTGEAGVGTFGGSEDHTAMLCCKAGMLSQFSFAPGVFERDIPFPAGVELAIAASGVEAVKTAAAKELYNRASLRARKAAEAFSRATGKPCKRLREIAVLVGPDGLQAAMDAVKRGTEPSDAHLDLPGRFEQFFREDQQLIPAVGDLLAAGNAKGIGELVDQSHRLADMGLQNQVEQTNFLQQSARELGATAATYFGAGFGGSVWAMVQEGESADFLAAWKKTYAEKFPRQAGRSEFFVTHPGSASSVVN